MLYPLSYEAVPHAAVVREQGYRVTGNTRPTRLVSTGWTVPARVRVSVSGNTTSPGNGAGDGRWHRMGTTVMDVPERGRFEIRVDDRLVGLASYHVDNGVMTLPHTEVDPSMGGRGLGTTLVTAVLDAARERGLHVLPYCSFVRRHIQQHPELIDLVAEADRPQFGLATADR